MCRRYRMGVPALPEQNARVGPTRPSTSTRTLQDVSTRPPGPVAPGTSTDSAVIPDRIRTAPARIDARSSRSRGRRSATCHRRVPPPTRGTRQRACRRSDAREYACPCLPVAPPATAGRTRVLLAAAILVCHQNVVHARSTTGIRSWRRVESPDVRREVATLHSPRIQ